MTVDDYMRRYKEVRAKPDQLIEAWKEYIERKHQSSQEGAKDE